MLKKITTLLVMAALCLNLTAKGQAADTEIKPLRVGAKVADTFWQTRFANYVDGRKDSTDLSAYKDKLLILDFWATWCGTCIKKFPMADSLEKRYAGKLKVMLVSSTNARDKPDKAMKLLDEQRKLGVDLESLIADGLLFKLFPHKTLPHYVWIVNGEIRAVTGTEFLTEQNMLVMMAAINENKLNN